MQQTPKVTPEAVIEKMVRTARNPECIPNATLRQALHSYGLSKKTTEFMRDLGYTSTRGTGKRFWIKKSKAAE